MTIEEVTAIIGDLRLKIPDLQRQLSQAEGYLQALMDMQNNKKDKNCLLYTSPSPRD